MKHPPHLHRQSGISLVEIMISLVVGLILTAGVIQIFIANKQTYRVADASARIQENARFALETVGFYLRIAGFNNQPADDDATAFPDIPARAPLGNSAQESRSIDFGFASTEVVRGSDTDIVIRYRGENGMRDCTGANVNPGEMVNMRLFLDAGELKCHAEVLDLATSPITEQSDQTQPLVSDVAAMTIRYGVDTNGDGTANSYVRAGSVANWSQVVSVRVTLTFQSAEANTSVTTGGRLQRTYTTTIALRNRLS